MDGNICVFSKKPMTNTKQRVYESEQIKNMSRVKIGSYIRKSSWNLAIGCTQVNQSVWVSTHSHTIPISTGFALCVIAVPPCTVHHKNLITSSNMGDLQGIIVIRRHADFFQCLRTHVTIIEKGTTPISKTKKFKLYRFCQTDSLWINGYLRC